MIHEYESIKQKNSSQNEDVEELTIEAINQRMGPYKNLWEEENITDVLPSFVSIIDGTTSLKKFKIKRIFKILKNKNLKKNIKKNICSFLISLLKFL